MDFTTLITEQLFTPFLLEHAPDFVTKSTKEIREYLEKITPELSALYQLAEEGSDTDNTASRIGEIREHLQLFLDKWLPPLLDTSSSSKFDDHLSSLKSDFVDDLLAAFKQEKAVEN